MSYAHLSYINLALLSLSQYSVVQYTLPPDVQVTEVLQEHAVIIWPINTEFPQLKHAFSFYDIMVMKSVVTLGFNLVIELVGN